MNGKEGIEEIGEVNEGCRVVVEEEEGWCGKREVEVEEEEEEEEGVIEGGGDVIEELEDQIVYNGLDVGCGGGYEEDVHHL
ncbi:hypothetical protein A2U01_0092842, partial [Trifolium medium]|nr:hypothetical protein [Trifolium medium]